MESPTTENRKTLAKELAQRCKDLSRPTSTPAEKLIQKRCGNCLEVMWVEDSDTHCKHQECEADKLKPLPTKKILVFLDALEIQKIQRRRRERKKHRGKWS